MLLIGTDGMHFAYADLTCVFNGVFNVILFTDCTAVCNGVAHDIGFIVRVKYMSFVKTVNKNYDLKTPVDKIFTFNTQQDANIFQKYVFDLEDDGTYEPLPDLVPKLKKNQKFKMNTY